MGSQHHHHMRRALELAEKGRFRVHPNPMVGCLVVKGNRVVGEGFHSRYGGPHAEVKALKMAGLKARGATLYVNLEPCHHWGKTPPCTPLLSEKGIKKVIVSHKDPNPKVAGKGLQWLKSQKIKVEVGCLSSNALKLNRPFEKWISQKRAWVIYKSAMSLDGKTATPNGESKWISSQTSRQWVHQKRGQTEAVLIGVGTLLRDDPHLTSHHKGNDPKIIILDPHLKIKATHRVVKKSADRLILVTSPQISPDKRKKFSDLGVQIILERPKRNVFKIKNILKKLSKMDINQILMEGGGSTAWNFFKEKCVDELAVFVSPRILGGSQAHSPVDGKGVGKVRQSFSIQNMSVKKSGVDILVQGLV